MIFLFGVWLYLLGRFTSCICAVSVYNTNKELNEERLYKQNMSNKVLGTFRKTDGSSVTVTEDVFKESDEMTAEEIHQGALSDPDAQPLTEKQLAKFKRVNPFPKK